MSELSQALGTAGGKHAITADGRTYEFGLVTQEVKVAFERRLYERAREAVRADREELGQDWYATQLEALRERYEEGEYAFESPKGQKALKSSHGVLLLLSLLTGADEMAVVRLLAARKDEALSVMKAVLHESFPGIKVRAAGGPKATASASRSRD